MVTYGAFVMFWGIYGELDGVYGNYVAFMVVDGAFTLFLWCFLRWLMVISAWYTAW